MPSQHPSISRRHFLAVTSLAAAAGVLGARSRGEDASPTPPTPGKPGGGGFEMAPLAYDYGALEPYIDAQTMQLHYSKHYAAYTKNLNEALKDYPALGKMKIEELLAQIDALPEPIRKAVRNNGGGYYNHGLFWRMMGPKGPPPEGALVQAITETFGSLDGMKKAFSAKAASVFGSGWAWLVVRNGRLEITNTPNQDSPIMNGIAEEVGKPVLGLDVWEHAYYLKYKNERAKYIDSWWNVVNWTKAGKLYSEAVG